MKTRLLVVAIIMVMVSCSKKEENKVTPVPPALQERIDALDSVVGNYAGYFDFTLPMDYPNINSNVNVTHQSQSSSINVNISAWNVSIQANVDTIQWYRFDIPTFYVNRILVGNGDTLNYCQINGYGLIQPTQTKLQLYIKAKVNSSASAIVYPIVGIFTR